MSGIALIAQNRGLKVTGSDLKESRYSRILSDAGVEVVYRQVAENITDDIDVVVISTAIPKNNPELVAAREKDILVWPRARMLAELGVGHKILAVAGTHGKTTTSSMLATSLDRLDADPTFLIGGLVNGYGSNAKEGDGDYYVVEADESDGSFVFINPFIALITNIDIDHLDHYDGIADIQEAFRDFMKAVPAEGAIVVCADCPNIGGALPREVEGRTVITYGFSPDAQVHITSLDERCFEVLFPDGERVELQLTCNPGRHNMCNAAGVLAVLDFLGYEKSQAVEAVAAFAGVRRRFEFVGEVNGITIIDDYGHHPTEIKATLKAAAALGYRRLHVLFQPHRYSRTQAFVQEFGVAFADADSVFILDVYAAGETPIPGVNGRYIADTIAAIEPEKPVTFIPHRADAVDVLADELMPGDLIITMGAGDVTLIGPQLLNVLRERER
jgi:UDP-N-acetylmuramate--alanine ligase